MIILMKTIIFARIDKESIYAICEYSWYFNMKAVNCVHVYANNAKCMLNPLSKLGDLRGRLNFRIIC